MKVEPVGSWGKQQWYHAKVGTGRSTVIIVRGRKAFAVGQSIRFAELRDVAGMCVGTTPAWRSGRIYDIAAGRLYVERM